MEALTHALMETEPGPNGSGSVPPPDLRGSPPQKLLGSVEEQGAGVDVGPTSLDIVQWMDEPTERAFRLALRRRQYQAGQLIYLQGDPGREMFCLVSGSVRMSVARADGREVIFTFFEPGDCFGNSSLIDDDPRPQSTEAASDVVVDVMDLVAFNRLRAEQRGFDHALLKLMARQKRILSDRFTLTSLNDLRSRVAARIRDAARSFGIAERDEIRLSLHLPQSELASMVGASRQSVNKALQRLQSDGLIRLEYGHIIVRDIGSLEAVAAEA